MAIGPSMSFMKKLNPARAMVGKPKFRVKTKAPARKVGPNVTMKSRSMPRPHGVFDKAFSNLKIRKDM